MKKLLKSLALVFVAVFGLCAFCACDKDKKNPEPPAPTNLTDVQVKTIFNNFYDTISANVGDWTNWTLLADQDSTITSNFSKLGLADSAGFIALDDENKLKANVQEAVQCFGLIAALVNEDQTIGKAFSIPESPYKLYVESANTEKIVIDVLAQTTAPAPATGTGTDVSNYYTILELYLNSAATNFSKLVATSHDGSYYSLSFVGDLKLTHLTCISAADGNNSVNLQTKQVNSILEFNLLALKGYATVGSESYTSKAIEDEATRKAVFAAVYKIDPTTIEATISANFEGKNLIELSDVDA